MTPRPCFATAGKTTLPMAKLKLPTRSSSSLTPQPSSSAKSRAESTSILWPPAYNPQAASHLGCVRRLARRSRRRRRARLWAGEDDHIPVCCACQGLRPVLNVHAGATLQNRRLPARVALHGDSTRPSCKTNNRVPTCNNTPEVTETLFRKVPPAGIRGCNEVAQELFTNFPHFVPQAEVRPSSTNGGQRLPVCGQLRPSLADARPILENCRLGRIWPNPGSRSCQTLSTVSP